MNTKRGCGQWCKTSRNSSIIYSPMRHTSNLCSTVLTTLWCLHSKWEAWSLWYLIDIGVQIHRTHDLLESHTKALATEKKKIKSNSLCGFWLSPKIVEKFKFKLFCVNKLSVLIRVRLLSNVSSEYGFQAIQMLLTYAENGQLLKYSSNCTV